MRKAKKKQKDYFRLRLYLVLGFFFVFFSVIFFRAVQLQVLDADKLKKLAAKQHRKTVNIHSKRGDIYDRNLKELAISVEVDSIFVQPGKIDAPRDTARLLAPLIGMNWTEVEKKLKSPGNFVWLKRQVDLSEEARKEVAAIEGVGIVKESRRYYPNRHLASNLVGFTGLDANGLEGIELYYDAMLKGSSHKFVSDKDAMGRVLLFEDPDKTVPVNGMEVEMTIDKTIQYITEKALKKAVDQYDAKGGSAIVMDPMTGEILAMASLPTYDPNDVKGSGPGQRRNKVIADTFEPGSIYKLFLIAAALEESIVKPKDRVFCENGDYRVADRVFHDTKDHGWLTIPEIIKYSSNIGSAKIGERLGKVQLYRYMKAFGFGTKTGIDLPGEVAGSLRHYKDWSAVTLHTVSFGQGISASGLQLITALSSIANGGFLMKPYVVKSIKDPNGNIIAENNPVIIRKVISEDTAKKVTDMLVMVTQEGGTGTRAALSDFEVAGKTGTAQKPDFKNGGYAKGAFMASFFGFVPAHAPRLAILVAIDEPKGEHYGGVVSGPVFKEIAEESLSYLGVFRENKKEPRVEIVKLEETAPAVIDEPAQTTAVAAADEDSPMSIPDFSGKSVRMVLKMAKTRQFDVEVVGSGKAFNQKPPPGHSAPSKGAVVVWFR